MSNVVKVILTFVVVLGLLVGIGTVVLNATGHGDLLPEFLQDPPVAEAVSEPVTGPATK